MWVSLPQKNYDLKELWEQYKVAKYNAVQATTRKDVWRTVSACLTKVSSDALKPENSQFLVSQLLQYYSVGTLARVLDELHACSNWAYENKLIPHNAWCKLKKQLPPKQSSNRSKKAFTKDEVDAIINAFHDNTYCSPSSAYKDSYYTDFVRFLFYTGCRPEDAIALKWADVKENVVVFSKSYSKGVLKSTKTGETRTFPINAQLREFLENRCHPMVRQPDKLVFPAPRGGYIDLHNFTNRYWSRVVKGLLKDGKISKYLPTYNLRNTSATLFLKKGVDKATIAALLGTSEKMLDEHYWSPDDDILSGGVKLPEL
jgi:integrase